jgi:alpha/beta superfamily hydrolase
VDAIRFTTEDGVSLEGELRQPDDDARGSAVVCHAHPRHGGSRDHPLLWAIRSELVARGLAVLSFDFRGVGGSAGTFGGGRPEVRDVAAAVGRVRAEAEGPTIVCGWSFGALVALIEAIADPLVVGLALVGLPIGDTGLQLPPLPTDAELRAFRRPVLLLSGQGDHFSQRPDLEAVARRLPNAELTIVPGTDHFFWRREAEVATAVAELAEHVLP